jgi:DivIVA domain-containing protein
MDVTPQELRGSEIKDAWRGYDRDEVDDLLERAAVTIEHLMLQAQEAASHPPIAAAAAAAAPEPVPLPSSRDDAEMLQRTLLLAQRAADDAVAEAQARAKQIVEEAEAKAQALVGDAEATARRIAEGERRRLEVEIQELSARRELLRGDADALDAYASGYRDKIRETLEADLAALSSAGSIDAPVGRPELHEVEVPVASPAEPAPAPAPAPPTPAPAAEEPAPSWDPGPATAATPAFTPEPAPAPAPAPAQASAAPVAEAAAQGEWPPPAAQAAPAATTTQAAPSAPAGQSGWLAADDGYTDAALDAPAPWERDTAYHEPFASETPMEANSVDTDSLSDDQFFASLREAVRDDAPLGPGEESVQGDFFEQDADDDRRRGFRRRR